MNRNEELKNILREKFMKSGKEVWRNWDKLDSKFEFKIVPRQKEKYARVIVNSNALPKSIGRTLLRVPKEITVEANENLFELKEDIINKVLKHEAIHIGNMKHNADFDRVAREVGTSMTMQQMLGIGFKVQVKKGSRYIDHEVFQTIEDARKFALELSKKERVRIVG